jgi:hypothetical protein
MTGMTRLATRRAAALRSTAPRARAARESVGGRRLRGGRRVSVAQGELPFQIRDLPIALRDFFAEPFNLARQSLDFGCDVSIRQWNRLR